MAPNLDLQLLGGFRIQLGEMWLPAFEHSRLQALLAYLALHRAAPQSRQQLAFLLWPASTEGQAAATCARWYRACALRYQTPTRS